MKILVCLAGAVIVSSARAVPQYRAEIVEAPGTAEFWGLNSAGTLVGWMDTPTNNKGLIRRPDGEVVIVEPPPGYEGYEVDFTDINESGQISGTLVHGFNGTGKGFVYTESGGFQIMNSAPNEAIASSSMTDDGLMAFTYSGGSGLWNPETNVFTSIARNGLQEAISGGRATGYDWNWHDGTFTQLQGVGIKFAQSIRSDGLTAGYKFVGANAGSVIWGANGSEIYTDFSPSYQSFFNDLNETGLAVGFRRISSTSSYGTIYSAESGALDVNSLIIEQNFSGPIRGLLRVENSGIAMGRVADGEIVRTAILRPVPEPGTMLALGAGLAALLRRRRAR